MRKKKNQQLKDLVQNQGVQLGKQSDTIKRCEAKIPELEGKLSEAEMKVAHAVGGNKRTPSKKKLIEESALMQLKLHGLNGPEETKQDAKEEAVVSLETEPTSSPVARAHRHLPSPLPPCRGISHHNEESFEPLHGYSGIGGRCRRQAYHDKHGYCHGPPPTDNLNGDSPPPTFSQLDRQARETFDEELELKLKRMQEEVSMMDVVD